MDILQNFDIILRNIGYSTDDVAKKLNITPQSLRTSLRGNPTLARLEAVASALECSISDLLDLKNDGIFGMVKINGKIFTIQSRQELKGFVIYCRRRLEFWNDEILPPLKAYSIDPESTLQIINSDLLYPNELEYILKAIKSRFMDGFYFSSFSSRLSIEISPERLIEEEYLDLKTLEEGLKKSLIAENKSWHEYQLLEEKGADKQDIESARQRWLAIADVRGIYDWHLRQIKGDTICLKHEIAGRFFPSPNPKIVLYLGSIRELEESPVAILIHELFHAFFYFASNQPTPIREIEEPMTEFATLEFLTVVSDDFKEIADDYAKAVLRKKFSIGRDCLYGFGHYLFKNIASLSSFEPTTWINSFPKLLKQISSVDNLVKNIIDRLNSPYPFLEEENILYDFEQLIFGTKSKKKTEKKVSEPVTEVVPVMKPREAVLESIRRIGKTDVTYEEIKKNIGKIDCSDIPSHRVSSLNLYDLDDEIQAGRVSVDDIESFKKHDNLSDEEKKKSRRLADASYYARRFDWDKAIALGILTLMHEGTLKEIEQGNLYRLIDPLEN